MLLGSPLLSSTMHNLTTLLIAILTFISAFRVLAQTATLAYDNTYDNGNLSLNQVACSDGKNGLETKGYTTLNSLPNFPNIGGFQTVTGWNSSACGTCYAVTYETNTVNILVMDVSKNGFTIAEAAMNNLTYGQAASLGRIDVSYVSLSPSACGLQD